jgi:hypothetical protein
MPYLMVRGERFVHRVVDQVRRASAAGLVATTLTCP